LLAVAIHDQSEHFAASCRFSAPLFDGSDDGLELVAFFELVDFPAFGHVLIVAGKVEEQIADSA